MNSSTLRSFRKTVIIFITAIVCGIRANLSCPKVVKIEHGEWPTILCTSNDKIVYDVYWYRGSTLSSGPILQLEGGTPGGLELGKGQYYISHNGAMIIKNASIAHEAVYTFVAYFKDGTHEKNDVIVNITLTPKPPCPQVNNCSSCGTCDLDITGQGSGKLVCYIFDARPQVEIKWLIKTQKRVTFVIHRSIWLKNSLMDSWSTKGEVSYSSEECGVEAELHCIASETFNLLNYSLTQVRLSTVSCTESTDDVTKTTSILPVIVIMSALAIITTVTSVSIYYRKRDAVSKEEQKVMRFQSRLKAKYKEFSVLQPFLSENDVPIDLLYTGCQCEVTYSDDNKTGTQSDKLLAVELSKTGRRTLISGGPGQGKTVFAKQLLQQWINETEGNYILLFIPLRGITKEMKVSALVKDNFLPNETDFTNEDIENIVSKCKCVILLDGLQDIPFETNDCTSIEEDCLLLGSKIPNDITTQERFTIADCLSGEINSYCSDVCVWVTSRNDHEDMFREYETLIRLDSFSKKQVKEYIAKCLSFYENAKDTKKCSESNGTNPIDDDENNYEAVSKTPEAFQMTSANSKQYVEDNGELEFQTDLEKGLLIQVFDFLEKRDIINDFLQVPHLLVTIIQIITAQFTGKTNRQEQNSNVHIDNTCTLIGNLVTFMENKYFDGSDKNLSSDVSRLLRNKLGELAFQTAFTDDFTIESAQSDYVEYVELALAIGYLQITDTSKSDTVSETTKIGFCHQYVHDYFTTYKISQNEVNFEIIAKKLSLTEAHRIEIFCKFSSLLKKPLLEQLCEVLRKNDMLNHVINCLFEITNTEYIENILEQVSKYQINLPHHQGFFHPEAVKAFCKTCWNEKEQWSVLFLPDLGLSLSLKPLTFLNSTVSNFITLYSLRTTLYPVCYW